MGMSLKQLNETHPLDLSQLSNTTDPAEYNRILHNAVRQQLKAGGLVSPTDSVTNFQLEPEDTPSWMDQMMRTVLRNNPEAHDSPEARDTYLQRRFEFISGHEGWRDKTYRDTRNLRTVGYGFNLEEPTNRALYKQVLNKTDDDFEALRNGETTLSKREGRILFEASAGAAERLISNKFKDVDLKGYERLSLVSLAYNHPGLIGPNLTKHVINGDKKAVLDEIMNKSNLHKSQGIQNRRNFEAEMFSGMDPDDADGSGWSLASIFGIKSAEAATMQSSDQLIEKGRGADVPRPKTKPTPPPDPKSTGSWLAGIVPSNARALISDLMGADVDTVRNEEWFSEGEQEAMRRLVSQKVARSGGRAGAIEYKDYEKGQSDVSFGRNNITGDDEYVVKTTLGQFNWKIDDRDHAIVTDQFNFNDAEKLQKAYPTFSDRVNNLLGYAMQDGIGAYGIVRRAAALFGSKEGEGAQFEVDLGPVSDQRMKVASR